MANGVFWFYFGKNMKDALRRKKKKSLVRLILSLDPSHRPAAGVATHWFATLIQVITIHHSDRLNTSLLPEGLPRGGGSGSPRTVIHKINYAHTHLSKHVSHIHVKHWQTNAAHPRALRFITWKEKTRGLLSCSDTRHYPPSVFFSLG